MPGPVEVLDWRGDTAAEPPRRADPSSGPWLELSGNVDEAGYGRPVEQWRQLIGHEGYFLVALRMTTPTEGGRGRAVQSGYRAVWWLVAASGETFLGSAPIDLADGQRSIRSGSAGRVRLHPLLPADWRLVQPGATVHLRERPGQTLGVGTVLERVGVPDEAPLRMDHHHLRPGAVELTEPATARAVTAQVSVERYGPAGPGPEGSVLSARFLLDGLPVLCSDSFVQHSFSFTPSVSLWVSCEAEAEVDRIAGALSAGGEVLMPVGDYGFNRRFGWVNDRFGVSWQLACA